MKKMTLMAVACAMLTACTQETINTEVNKKEVTFTVPMAMEMVPMDGTRATLAEANTAKLYVVVDGALVDTQLSTDSDFGTPTLELDYGTHSVSFVASAVDLTFSGGDFTPSAGVVQDAFGKTVSITIDRNTTNQTVALDRIISGLRYTIEDAIPTGTKTAKLSITTHYKTATVSSMTGIEDDVYTREFDISSKVGSSNITLSAYTYCPDLSNEWTTTTELEFKRADNTTIVKHTIDDAGLKCNRLTNIHGVFFAKNPTATISVNNTWDMQNDIAY